MYFPQNNEFVTFKYNGNEKVALAVCPATPSQKEHFLEMEKHRLRSHEKYKNVDKFLNDTGVYLTIDGSNFRLLHAEFFEPLKSQE